MTMKLNLGKSSVAENKAQTQTSKSFENLSAVEDVLPLHRPVCYFFPDCLSHLMFIEIHQSPIKVSVSDFNGQLDGFTCGSFGGLVRKHQLVENKFQLKFRLSYLLTVIGSP